MSPEAAGWNRCIDRLPAKSKSSEPDLGVHYTAMAFINTKERSIQIKLVYCGPSGAGKTATLRHINSHLREKSRGGLVTIGPAGQGTSFMDFMSFTLPDAGHFDLRVRLYALPGQSRYAEARKILLKGTDGIIFVADLSAEPSVNRSALTELSSQLAFHGKKLARIPLVLQLNKSDMAGREKASIRSSALLQELDPRRTRPYFASSAREGKGVLITLKNAIVAVINQVEKKYREIDRPAKPAAIAARVPDEACGKAPEQLGAGRIDIRKLFRKPAA